MYNLKILRDQLKILRELMGQASNAIDYWVNLVSLLNILILTFNELASYL